MKIIGFLRKAILISTVGVTTFFGVAHAGPYSQLVIFGDSLSDTGNLLALTSSTTNFPNFSAAPGRFSNGPVWTEYLAQAIGLSGDAAPALAGGNNFAFGGARTGLDGVVPQTGLFGQLGFWNGGALTGPLNRSADPNALYVVVAGGNDLRDAVAASGSDSASRVAAATQAAQNVTNVLGLLVGAGAKHFLVASLPDLGKTPEAIIKGTVLASTEATLAFNAAFSAFLNVFSALDVRQLDLFSLNNNLIANPGAFGILNVNTACISPLNPGVPGFEDPVTGLPGIFFAPGATDSGNCNSSVYADYLHPSGIAHQLIGAYAAAIAIPEPGSLMLVLSAVAALLVVRRRRVKLTIAR